MTTINDLSSTNTVLEADSVPVWRAANSDTRKATMGTLQAYMQDNLDFLVPDGVANSLSVTSTSGTTKLLSAWAEDIAQEDAAQITPEDYGAKGDGIYFQSQGVMSAGSAAFTCGNGAFTAADIGKSIVVQGAGPARSRVSAVAINAGGASYVVGDILTVSGGTVTYTTKLRVTSVSAGAVTGVEIWENGLYTTLPSNPVSVTGGSGSSCTLNLTGTTVYMPLATTISAYSSATAITLATTATTAVTSASFTYATDDTAAFQAMETARMLLPWGTSCVLRAAIYGIKNVRILSRDSGGPGRTQEGWTAIGGRAHLACIGVTDADYMVASNRWVDGQNWTGLPNTPIAFRNIRFDGSNLVKVPLIQKGYQNETFDCEFFGGLIGHHKIARQNQYEQTLTITGNTNSSTSVITNATFVSSTGAAVGLSDIRLYHIVNGTAISGTRYITAIDVGAQTITMSGNSASTLVGTTLYINQNSCANGYNSECRAERNEYIASTAMPGTYLFKNEGTTVDPGDASTDGYFIDNIVDGQDVTPFGTFFGNMGGWFISGTHAYASTWDHYVYEMGGNYRWFDNQYEYPVFIYKVGGKRVVEPNTFWQSVTVGFGSNTSTEELIFQDPKFTVRASVNYAQLICKAAYANKTVVLFNPVFTTGASATGTAPITRPNSLGTIIVRGGRDGDGDMGNQTWDDSATGVRLDNYHVSASPAASDIVWRNTYSAKNASGTKKTFGSAEVVITDTTNGSEDATTKFYAMVAGTETLRLSLKSDVESPVAFISSATGAVTTGFQAYGESTTLILASRYTTDTSPPELSLFKYRGTKASPADVSQFDTGARINLGFSAGGTARNAAQIYVSAEASNPSAGAGDAESALVFSVTQAAAVSPTAMVQLKYSTGQSNYGSVVIDAANGIRHPSYTSATLNAIANAVNTSQKAAGKTVYNSTVTKLVTAVGSTAGSVWVDGAGTTINTPV